MLEFGIAIAKTIGSFFISKIGHSLLRTWWDHYFSGYASSLFQWGRMLNLNAHIPVFVINIISWIWALLKVAQKSIVRAAQWIREDDLDEAEHSEHESDSENELLESELVCKAPALNRKQGQSPIERRLNRSLAEHTSSDTSNRKYTSKKYNAEPPKRKIRVYVAIAFLLFHLVSVVILASAEYGKLDSHRETAQDKFDECKKEKGGEARCHTEKNEYTKAEAQTTVLKALGEGLGEWSPIGGVFPVLPFLLRIMGVETVFELFKVAIVLAVPLSFVVAFAYFAWKIMTPSKTKKLE